MHFLPSLFCQFPLHFTGDPPFLALFFTLSSSYLCTYTSSPGLWTVTSLHEQRESWQAAVSSMILIGCPRIGLVSTLSWGGRERELLREGGKITARMVESNFQGAKCSHIRREIHRKANQHLVLTVDIQQQLCRFSSDLFTCTKGYWLRYNYKCCLKCQVAQRKTLPHHQPQGLDPYLLYFFPSGLGAPFECNWGSRTYKATKDHIFVTALIATTGWFEYPFRGNLLDLHVLLPPEQLLLADEKKQVVNPCLSEICTLPRPTEGVITVATKNAVQREMDFPKLRGQQTQRKRKRQWLQGPL